MKKRIIDITRTISNNSVVYPGMKPLKHSPLFEIDENNAFSITSLINWNTHFLTHIDPPSHFLKDGKSIDEIPLNRFCGNVKVIEVTGDKIDIEQLESIKIDAGTSIFFKTKNSNTVTDNPFDKNHTYISKELAQFLSDKDINMVGIDYLSVDGYGNTDFDAHYILLKNEILILEGLLLKNVRPGDYLFYAFPLKIHKGDGSPTRALLQEL